MQAVSQQFRDHADGDIRPLSYGMKISFDKTFDDSVTFFTLNSSLLDSGDLLGLEGGSDLQQWDFYNYKDYTDRLVSVEWSREIDFPYSVSAAMVDFVLNNFDNYFTPNSGSPIDQYILPKRPIRVLSGFSNENIPQVVAITENMPIIDDTNKQASFHAIDFLSEMFNLQLTDVLAMQNARTDEVLAAIFEQYGMSSSQYELAKGRNVIPFLFFDPGKNTGNLLRDLMQAEMGNLWLTEDGLIKFEQRLLPKEEPVMIFDDSNIISLKTSGDNNIINMVKVKSDIRKVQGFQPVWSLSEAGGTGATADPSVTIDPSSSKFINASLTDPLLTVDVPTLGRSTSESWFVATTLSGVEVPSNVSVSLSELRSSTYVMTLHNTNAFPVIITEMEVWGEPAKVVDNVDYTAYDDISVEKYGQQILEIDNDFVQSVDNADALAETVLDAYSEFAGQIVMEVKGNPALQLGDVIYVNALTYDGTYKVSGIANKLSQKKYTQTITARRYTPRDWFILDESQLDGSDVLAP